MSKNTVQIGKTKMVFDWSVMDNIRKSQAAVDIVNDLADTMASEAGNAEVSQHMTKRRYKATVKQKSTGRDMDEETLAKAQRRKR